MQSLIHLEWESNNLIKEGSCRVYIKVRDALKKIHYCSIRYNDY